MVPWSLGCGSAVFAAIATLAPSRAARNAIASPMPRLPPDTNSVLPLSEVIERAPNRYGTRKSSTSAYREREQAFVANAPGLGIRMQDPAARFRQCKCRDEEHAVSRYRENRDGVAERSRG